MQQGFGGLALRSDILLRASVTDATLVQTLQEAAEFSSARTLRSLFVQIVANHEVRDAAKLYATFRLQLCDDFTHKRRREHYDFTLAWAEEDEALAVEDMDQMLASCSSSTLAEHLVNVSLPVVRGTGSATGRVTVEAEERLNHTLDALLAPGSTVRTSAALASQLAAQYAQLRDKQKALAHMIIRDVNDVIDERRTGATPFRSRAHWLAGRAGCGKTTLNNYIIRKVRTC